MRSRTGLGRPPVSSPAPPPSWSPSFRLPGAAWFKQFGVGLAAAILIDATIVRAVLLPATMKLLGDWNWYLPRWLQWLPRLERFEPEPRPSPRRRVKPAHVPAIVQR